MKDQDITMNESASAQARNRVKDDLWTLAADAEALLKATASDASEKTREARQRLTAALEKTKAGYLDLQDRSIESAKEAAKKADTMVRTHPYESIGIAFGVGLLLGAILRRR